MNNETSGATFGPYYVTRVLAARESTELALSVLFVDGESQRIALRRTRALDDGAHDALLVQAQRYAVLHHPNIVEVRDLGSLEGRSYVATDFVRGFNLLRVLSRCGQRRLGFPTEVALFVADRVLEALQYAHTLRGAHGEPLPVLHGDISHSNILLTPTGGVRLSDFGLSFASTRRRTHRGLNIGGGKGYCCYMAPEQLRNEPLDHRSDLFALGVVLYELVTGRLLLTADTETDLLNMVAQGAIVPRIDRHRPDLHPALTWIIETALSPSPCDRFSSAAEFRSAIADLLRAVHIRLDRTCLTLLIQRLFSPEEQEMDSAP
ncbi:MAG: serine/threonine protein kinase [Deltaproteobacteria bacterium]|nr:serine/threonine protein kinase [Deltaproteobacteria bacterium]